MLGILVQMECSYKHSSTSASGSIHLAECLRCSIGVDHASLRTSETSTPQSTLIQSFVVHPLSPPTRTCMCHQSSSTLVDRICKMTNYMFSQQHRYKIMQISKKHDQMKSNPTVSWDILAVNEASIKSQAGEARCHTTVQRTPCTPPLADVNAWQSSMGLVQNAYL